MHIIFDLDDAQQHVTTSCLDMLEPEIIHENKVIVYKSYFELLVYETRAKLQTVAPLKWSKNKYAVALLYSKVLFVARLT